MARPRACYGSIAFLGVSIVCGARLACRVCSVTACKEALLALPCVSRMLWRATEQHALEYQMYQRDRVVPYAPSCSLPLGVCFCYNVRRLHAAEGSSRHEQLEFLPNARQPTLWVGDLLACCPATRLSFLLAQVAPC